MNLDVPEKLLPVFENLQTARYDAIPIEGGRGGAKSQALALIGVLESFVDDGTILCCREIQKSIKDSSYSAIVSTIEKHGLSEYFKILNNEITNLRTGAKLLFAGLKSNITSIKSIDKLRVVLVDEAENVSQNSWDYLRPTPRYGKVRIYVVFNPRFEADPTWQEFIVKKDSKTLHITINWRDNPWFPESLNNQRLRDMRGDAGRYMWIWEGKFLKISDASILAKKLVVEDFEVNPTFKGPYLGIDWGFSVDPTAVVECYTFEDCLYIRNAASKVGLELDDTAEYLQDHAPIIRKYRSRADCSRPETISKVKKELPLVDACKKWSGCVEDGVVVLQSFKQIVIHPDAECCLGELTAYSYKLDDEEKPTAVIEDKNNHYADALRYAIEPIVTSRRKMRISKKVLERA